MPSSLERILFVPDTHCPYHDHKAWKLMMNAATAFKPDTIVVQGDLADFYAVSNYSKDPARAGRLDVEVAECNTLLDELDSLGAGKKIFIGGNHEDRLERYLKDKAPELFAFVDVSRLFHLSDRGWEYVPYKSSTKIGKLNITHDVGSAGRYNAFRALDIFQHPVATGHTHRMSYVVEGNATGESAVSAQFGWLGDFSKVDYMHRVKALREWALGFGIGYFNPKSDYVYLVPVPIVGYTCILEGNLITL